VLFRDGFGGWLRHIDLARLPHTVLPGGVVLAEARTPLARLRGLALAAPPPPGWALRLAPCASVQTALMRYALDLVWLGRDGAVVRVDRGVRPWRVRSCRGAAAVIEVPAGGAGAVLEEAGRPPTPGPFEVSLT